ncbi:5-formyltetrahydrofolate cyclo-ligase [Aurantibacter crassamenti]|uniref:5-formyltetrahydrofolate cyclo-ligase n=1 Tax=Aurantibacter crassamenti TaxID=1837375 RepID=UPI001939927C|nr:5-formyltetrahydrofolate cyclo-ligase [Aurantibacter crassamenti]MBM1104907.1 5-formyltetrahydrofolate cyclo-ligase [Aurantibacter crassamenti]
MNKKDLRLDYKKRRKNCSPQFLANASLGIANNALKIPIWNFDYYHIFLPITSHKEPDTSYLLSILQGKDKNIVLPKVSNQELKHYLLTDNTRLKNSSLNIPEPVDGIEIPIEKIEVVFVPLLAFDISGNRVGYGKGFYDKFLSGCKPETIKVGLSLFEPVEKISDVYENDVPLDYCITPEKNYSFVSE